MTTAGGRAAVLRAGRARWATRRTSPDTKRSSTAQASPGPAGRGACGVSASGGDGIVGGVTAATTPLVAPVAGLGQRVGPEADVRLGRHQLVDDRLVGAGVEVMDHLRPLVPEVALLLEPNRPLHAWTLHRTPEATGNRRGRPTRAAGRSAGLGPHGA